MAMGIHYEVPAPAAPDEARQELDRLLNNLHKHGVLRIANDFLEASTDVSRIVLAGANQPQSRNVMQNVSLLVMALGKVPPERLAVLSRAVTEGLERMETAADERQRSRAPGLTGTYKLLHDEALWSGLSPLLEGLRGFAQCLHEKEEKPAAKRHD
ncbi:hypothetical protein CEK62_07945 [Alcanivorax sp. N3-2A]|nr:hypothetical protein CEK62_07945 [Alcanivorax sp. N3-2A]|tara:strand:+ start:130557 stop:131024 length:468 start_codon:yes stop_codon:yes gene_type:complete